MKRIILTRGIPASGKSTWAKQEVLKDPEHSVRINRDDLRNMCGKYCVLAREKYILSCRNLLLNTAIYMNFNTIIIDDINLNPRDIDYIIKAVNYFNKVLTSKNQYKIEFKDFTNVPLNVCIERDSKRENSLGEKVIRGIFNKYQTRYNLKEK